MNTLNIEAKLAQKYGYKPLPKDLSEKYRQFYIDNLPDCFIIDGSDTVLCTKTGTVVCNGYTRIVVGDYGAFIEFDKDYLRELFEQGRTSDKKHRYQPEVIKGYQKAVASLKRAINVEMLYRLNSLNYEVLKGDKKGISSVRINQQYRLEFTVRDVMNEQIITVCRLLDISNHYK